MPYYLAERVLVIKSIASPADATGEYLELVYAPPGTAGAVATRAHTTEQIFHEVIVRGSPADCVGDYLYAYDEGSGGPPGGGTASYLLRWYGAGVADQQFSDGQVLQWSDEGMLDGQAVCGGGGLLTDDAYTGVKDGKFTAENLGAAASWGIFDVVDRSTPVQGQGVWCNPWTNYPTTSNSNTLHVGFLGSQSGASGSNSQLKVANTNGVYDIYHGKRLNGPFPAPDSEIVEGHRMGVIKGGFNGSGEPMGAVETGFEFGSFIFTQHGASESQLKLEFVSALTNNANTKWPGLYALSSQSNGIRYADYLIVPDADLSSMLTPVVMDTFNRADGPLGDADVGGSWAIDIGNVIDIVANKATSSIGGGSPSAIIDAGTADVVVRGVGTKILNTTASTTPMLVLRHTDNNNLWSISYGDTGGGSTLKIQRRELGVWNIDAETAISDVLNASYPMVGIADGDTITAAWNDATAVSVPTATFQQTETTHGFGGYSGTDPQGWSMDNFSVYPRRSTSQYDDVIQPYIDGLGTVAPSNPVKPKYLLEADFSVLPDSVELNDGELVPGVQVGSLTVGHQVPGAEAPFQIVSGTLRTKGDRDVWAESENIGQLVAGRTYIVATQGVGTTGSPNPTYRFADTPYYGRTAVAKIGSIVSATSGSNGTLIGHLQRASAAAALSFARYPAQRLDTQHAMVAGDFSAGEPGSGAEGVYGFEKIDGDGQWLLGYVAAVGNETPADVSFLIRGGSVNTDQRTKHAAIPYDPLPQLLTPVVLDRFNRADGTVGDAETGQTWQYDVRLDVSNNKLVSSGGWAVGYIDTGLTDYVARLVSQEGNNTESVAARLQIKVLDFDNRIDISHSTNTINVNEVLLGSSNAIATTTWTHQLIVPVVGIADGDTVTVVVNDSVVVSATELNSTLVSATGAGVRISSSHVDNSIDNFQVLPRRSYSQYDEVLDSYVPGYVEPIFEDNFTDANGTAIEAHTPDTPVGSNIWTSNDGHIIINDNYASKSGGITGNSRAMYDIGTSNFRAIWECMAAGSGDAPTIVFRSDGTDNDVSSYWVYVYPQGNYVTVYRNGGTWSGNTSIPVPLDVWHTVRLECIGDSIKVWFNDVLTHDLTDTNNNHTQIGFRIWQQSFRNRNNRLKIYDLS